MAFMAPIIKPGWNLYNCNPPPGRVRYVKAKTTATNSAATTASSSGGGNAKKALESHTFQDAKLKRRSSLPATVGRAPDKKNRPCKNSNPKLMAPVKAIHARPTTQGHYQLSAFSTDSLRMRNLDVAMQAIPEENGDEEDFCDSENSSTSELSGFGMVSSNPELVPSFTSHLQQPRQERRAQRLFARFRKMFRSIAAANEPACETDTSPPQQAREQRTKSLPNFLRNLHRRRS
ncbi:hypothetical protein BV898_04303 [Hypsibius exemplaris]|uniref:Uncharacterized protein n=1 Tax=Hypsibius exemplaris TaxID=2072580 RepID=A0A1W0X2N4_HYPEX|nr:hypothetical protein BV898_04303 [Hypsibius exemplaris]